MTIEAQTSPPRDRARHQDRRSFLSGLVSLPLIGGGVTLIGRPAAHVPLAQAMAAPAIVDPRERARYAWEAFSAAMREITADANGWIIAAGERRPFRGVEHGGTFLSARKVFFEIDVEPRAPGLVVERWADISLTPVGGRA